MALIVVAMFIGFIVWLFVKPPSEVDLRRQEASRMASERSAEIERIRLENTRTACNAGLQTACVEYAEMID